MTNKQPESGVVCIYKQLGETPLQALHRLREHDPRFKHTKLSYAGRLDPMAEGVLLVLVGEENKHRQKYLNLDKTYEVEILFGFETDTQDALGKITTVSEVGPRYVARSDLDARFQTFIGTFFQPYPAYSSKTVQGKPLFEWAREGKLHEISIPTKKVSIFNIDVLETKTVSGKELYERISENIKKVHGDFRQNEILALWQRHVKDGGEFVIAKIQVTCSSGAYMRSLAKRIGIALEIGGCALAIKRLKIGVFGQNDCITV